MSYIRELTRLVQAYVTALFNKYQTPVLVYHNLMHTLTVVDRAKEIGANYSLGENDLFILLSAAWFHDCGHLFGPAEKHEQRSAVIMKEYMETIAVDESTVTAIEQCILSTKMPASPASLLAAILCDADVYHFGTGEFPAIDELVKKEFESRNIFLPQHWNETTLALLKSHAFFTDYCKGLLENGKLKNIAYLEELIKNKI